MFNFYCALNVTNFDYIFIDVNALRDNICVVEKQDSHNLNNKSKFYLECGELDNVLADGVSYPSKEKAEHDREFVKHHILFELLVDNNPVENLKCSYNSIEFFTLKYI